MDLGGTWLRVLAVDRRGRLLRRAKIPAPPPAGLAAALRRLWRDWDIDAPVALTVGSKGVWKRAPRAAMEKSLKGLAENIRVMSDVELAYLNVLGERPGVLLLAGTGSIALARDVRGRWHRAGGLGPMKGDEGSAFWIGRQFKPGKRTPTPEEVRRTAALARVVCRRRDRPACAAILDEAARHLANLVGEAARKAGLRNRRRVGWWGGLMSERGFRRKTIRLLGEVALAAPRRPAEAAAARLGRMTS